MTKEYYDRNKERISAQRKEYYLRNRKRLLAYRREYHHNNREREILRSRGYAETHRESARSCARKHYINRYSKRIKYMRKYYTSNQEHLRTLNQQNSKLSTSALSDSYLKRLIKKCYGIEYKEIPESVIYSKRILIQIKRELTNQIENGNN